ncbi:MAG TPA: rhodanese-like domain-containing protein, partial [Candidatus Binatia bacterium]|nr:rhodanese-like domain-containing protein [Candidatus Binatia bacterium]
MTGFARPELLASTEWLADELGRPDVRIVDVRWRPDGSGASLHAAGHIPGAVHLDWAADLAEADDERGLYLLAGPDRVAGALERAGVGDGTTVVLYDDTASLYAARTWWSLRVYGFESARILDGGIVAWLAEGRPLSSAAPAPPRATFTPRAQLRIRLTTSDVRALLGSTDVLLVDARAPAEYRGFEGNTKRLGHIPGAVNVPVVLTLMGHDDVAVYDGGWAEW